MFPETLNALTNCPGLLSNSQLMEVLDKAKQQHADNLNKSDDFARLKRMTEREIESILEDHPQANPQNLCSLRDSYNKQAIRHANYAEELHAFIQRMKQIYGLSPKQTCWTKEGF